MLKHGCQAGFTFFEILAASMVASVVAGGTLMAFVTAARITGAQNHASIAEANDLGAQVLEQTRNFVAADDATLDGLIGAGWQNVPFDSLAGGTQSILAQTHKRCRLVQLGCGGNCYEVRVQVCWNNVGPGSGCSCP